MEHGMFVCFTGSAVRRRLVVMVMVVLVVAAMLEWVVDDDAVQILGLPLALVRLAPASGHRDFHPSVAWKCTHRPGDRSIHLS